jgi:predicted nucleic acid-binding protein
VKYLVDANVLSEPTRPLPDQGVVSWLRRNESRIAIDPIILGELRFGILLLPAGQPVKDSLIAATALVHGLRVVTRNSFAAAGVNVINPFGV